MSSASGTSSEERAEILSSMNVVGGRLKLKGVTIKGSRVKRSAPTPSDAASSAAAASLASGARSSDAGSSPAPSAAAVTAAAAAAVAASGERVQQNKTKAELDYEKAMDQKMQDEAVKRARKTHRQSIEEFNTYLGKLSEHNQMPRVGPG